MDDELNGHDHRLGISPESVHPLVGESPRPRSGIVSRRATDLFPFLGPRSRIVLINGEEEVLFAREVPIDGAGGVSTFCCYLIERSTVIAMSSEDPGRGRYQFGAGFLLSFSSS